MISGFMECFSGLTEVLRRLKIGVWSPRTGVLWEHVCKKKTKTFWFWTFKSAITNSCCTPTCWLPVGSFRFNSRCASLSTHLSHTQVSTDTMETLIPLISWCKQKTTSSFINLEHWESCTAVGSSAVNQAEWMAGAVTLLALGTVGTDSLILSG